MTLGIRKLIIVSLIVAVIMLAKVWAIAGWLDRIGVVGWAWSVRAEFITGTAVTVIAALLILLPSTVARGVPRPEVGRRCPVCDEGLRPCPACGSRV